MRHWLVIAMFIVAKVAVAAPMGIIVPAYFYPVGNNGWSAMDFAAARIPLIAILNPDSGPGSSRDPNFVTAVANVHKAGGQVVGYVHTTYGTRPMLEVTNDINAYVSWYILDGFFIDEMANDANTNDVNYYAAIYQYIKGINPNYSVTGNPGTSTLETYLTTPTADTLMIFENQSTNYPANVPSSWVANHPAPQFANIAYGSALSAATMSNFVALATSRNTGWIFFSDADLPNPYDVLPSYWTNEVELVQALNAGTVPVSFTDPTRPLDQIVRAGAPATFNVLAAGSMPLSYQWFKDANPIASATNASYTNPSAQPGDNGAVYYCQVTNLISSTNSRTAALTVTSNTSAATYTTITINGSFNDWAGVPLAYSQPQDTTNTVAYQNIYLCNDSNYLYIRFTLYPPAANPFTGRQNIFINADDNDATGYDPYDAVSGDTYVDFGSEMLIQAGAGFQEKNGGFNEGGINGLNWAATPATGTNFEARISRNATYASDGTPVFTGNTIALMLEAEDTNYNSVEFAPTNGSGGLVYTFASNTPPGPLSVTLSGQSVIISWPGSGTLQSAGSVSNGATWSNVTGMGNLYSTVATNSELFFRLVR